MKQSSTPSQVIQEIQTAATEDGVDLHFEFLYQHIKDHLFKAYCSLLWNEFFIRYNSGKIPEDVFYALLKKLKKDIREGAFDPSFYPDDEALCKGLVAWVMKNAWRRVASAFKRKQARPITSADLSDEVRELQFDDAPDSSNITLHIADALNFVLPRLSEKDRDIVKTYYWECPDKAEAQAILIERHSIKSDVAFKRAISRAQERFKALLYIYKKE